MLAANEREETQCPGLSPRGPRPTNKRSGGQERGGGGVGGGEVSCGAPGNVTLSLNPGFSSHPSGHHLLSRQAGAHISAAYSHSSPVSPTMKEREELVIAAILMILYTWPMWTEAHRCWARLTALSPHTCLQGEYSHYPCPCLTEGAGTHPAEHARTPPKSHTLVYGRAGESWGTLISGCKQQGSLLALGGCGRWVQGSSHPQPTPFSSEDLSKPLQLAGVSPSVYKLRRLVLLMVEKRRGRLGAGSRTEAGFWVRILSLSRCVVWSSHSSLSLSFLLDKNEIFIPTPPLHPGQALVEMKWNVVYQAHNRCSVLVSYGSMIVIADISRSEGFSSQSKNQVLRDPQTSPL